MPDDERTPSGETDGATTGPAGAGSTPVPSTDDATGYGLTMTLVGAVLLALAYYGLVAVRGPRELGQALPEPFYGLAFAVLFAVELLQRGTLSVAALARAIALAVVYGGLFVFAAEGAAYLWAFPQVALAGYAGVTVFAGALVVAVLVYVGYLTVIQGGTSAS